MNLLSIYIYTHIIQHINALYYIATASNDYSAAIWAKNGTLIYNLKGHDAGISDIAFSPNGNYLATGSFDYKVKIWDVHSGSEIGTLIGHSGKLRDVAFSPDSKYLATGASDKTAKLWSIPSGELINTLNHNGTVRDIVFSPDSLYVVTGSLDDTAKIWDIRASGALTNTLDRHTGNIYEIAYSPNGQYIATTSKDTTAILWRAPNGTYWKTLHGHTKLVSDIDFSPDSKYLVTCSDDFTAKLWDVESGELIKTLTGHKNFVNDVIFSPNGEYIVTVSRDKTAKVWSVPSGLLLHTLVNQDDLPLWEASFSPDSVYVATCGDGTVAHVWEVSSGRLVESLDAHTARVTEVVYSNETTLVDTPLSANPTISPVGVETVFQDTVASCSTKSADFVCKCDDGTHLENSIIFKNASCHYKPFTGTKNLAMIISGIITCIFVLFACFGLWSLHNPRLAIDLSLDVFAPIADLVTDVYFLLTATFYSVTLFCCSVVFLLLPCIYSGYWLYKNSELNYQSSDIDNLHKLILYPLLLIAWNCVGFVLFQTKLLAFVEIRNKFVHGWKFRTVKPTDKSSRRDLYGIFDIVLFNKFRIVEVLFESGPMIGIQIYNAIAIGSLETITIVSFVFSLYMVCNILYVYVFRVIFLKKELHEVPVGCRRFYDWNEIHTREDIPTNSQINGNMDTQAGTRVEQVSSKSVNGGLQGEVVVV